MNESDINYINKSKEIIYLSPIKSPPRSLLEIRENIDIITSNLKNKLKVVLMGSVKAGKSTFVNAIAGKDISPMGVVETTATIIKIKYSEHECATIFFYDETSKKDSIENIFNILNNNKGNEDFFKNCKEVVIEKSLEKLRNIEIVDTPGLNTLRSNNENIAKNYIEHADVVIWLLNANSLGQESVEEYVSEIYKLGKPIIGVINHIDDIEADYDEVVESVKEDSLGMYFKEVFPLVAIDAYNANVNHDENKLKESGFSDIIAYLYNNIDKAHVKIKTESVLDSIMSQLYMCEKIHVSEANIWKEKEEAYKFIEDELIKTSHKIVIEANNYVDNFINKDMLKYQKDKISSYINNIGFIDSITTSLKKEIKIKIEEEFCQEAIEKDIKRLIIGVNEYMADLWKLHLESMGRSVVDKFNVKLDLNKLMNNRFDNMLIDDGDTKTIVTESVITGTILGVGASAYAAGLGTYAAHLSIYNALGSFMPPIFIASTLVGVFLSKYKFDKMKKEFINNLNLEVYKYRKKFKDSTNDEMKNYIIKSSAFITNHVKKEIIKNDIHMEIHDLKNYVNNLDVYLYSLREIISKAPSYSSVFDTLLKDITKLTEKNNELMETIENGLSADDNELLQQALDETQSKLDELNKEYIKMQENYNKKIKESETSEQEKNEIFNQYQILKNELNRENESLTKMTKQLKKVQKERNHLESIYKKQIEELNNKLLASLKRNDAMEISDNADIWNAVKIVSDETRQYNNKQFCKVKEQCRKRYNNLDEDMIENITNSIVFNNFWCNVSIQANGFIIFPALKTVEIIMDKIYNISPFKRTLSIMPGEGKFSAICRAVKKNEISMWTKTFAGNLDFVRKKRNNVSHPSAPLNNSDYDALKNILFGNEGSNGGGMLDYLNCKYLEASKHI